MLPETIIIFTRSLKAAKEGDIPIRYELLKAFSKCFRSGGKGTQEHTVAELVRIAKSGMLEKYPLIRSASAEVYSLSILVYGITL